MVLLVRVDLNEAVSGLINTGMVFGQEYSVALGARIDCARDLLACISVDHGSAVFL